MFAIGMAPRISALVPLPSGDDATYGECHAVLVCTGTMMVTPSTVTALWSDGPAPPRRLAAPAAGSSRRSPTDCSSVRSSVTDNRLEAGVISLEFMVGAPVVVGECGGHGRCCRRRPVVDGKAEQFRPGVVPHRIHHSLAL